MILRLIQAIQNNYSKMVKTFSDVFGKGFCVFGKDKMTTFENYFLDDGAYMSVKILCEVVRCKRAGKNIEDLLEGLEEPAECKEFRMKI